MTVNTNILFVLIIVLTTCYGGLLIQKHDKPSEKLGIVYPTYADIANYSFTVAVLVDIDLLGGGALIQQNWVLTAASVLRGFNASDLSVRVASNYSYKGGRVHAVTSIIVHPNYTTNSSYNLALLKLDSPIYPKVATKVSYYARIPFADNGIPGNTTGYGATSSSQSNGNGLQIAQGTVYTGGYCQRRWSRPVSSLHICAYSYSVVPCSGDEGDPLTRCWGDSQCELLGIATWSDPCDTYEPYTFVDVGQFAEWIRKSINQSILYDDELYTDI